MGGWGREPFSRNFMKPTPRRKWYLTTGRSFHEMVLEPIPQSLPVHFFGSRPQPPTSPEFTRALLQKRPTDTSLCRRPYVHISRSPLQRALGCSGLFCKRHIIIRRCVAHLYTCLGPLLLQKRRSITSLLLRKRHNNTSLCRTSVHISGFSFVAKETQYYVSFVAKET